MAKWKAVSEFAKDNGIEFKIITEDELGIKQHGRGTGRVSRSDTLRTEDLIDVCEGLTDPDDKMAEVLERLSQVEVVPDVGRYYTFIYRPKTPRIRYDEYPLIACTDVNRWGFKGLNYHWGSWRNYTWEEVQSNLHVVYPRELEDLRSINYQKFDLNI